MILSSMVMACVLIVCIYYVKIQDFTNLFAIVLMGTFVILSFYSRWTRTSPAILKIY